MTRCSRLDDPSVIGIEAVAVARPGGASALTGAWRVTFWGALAMLITAGSGAAIGTAV